MYKYADCADYIKSFTDDQIFLMGTILIYFITLWGNIFIVMLIDYLNIFQKYKIQKDKKPELSLIYEALSNVIIGHSLFIPLLLYYYKPSYLNITMKYEELPSLIECILILILWQFLFDTYFYWTHRLLHHSLIYQYIHKQHHKFKVPVGISALYAHPIEDLLVNNISTFIGPLLYPSHFYLWLIHLGLRFHETVDAHSGYIFPWSPWKLLTIYIHGGASRHDWHHSNQVGNYGGYIFWDWFCGTDKSYKKWLEKNKEI